MCQLVEAYSWFIRELSLCCSPSLVRDWVMEGGRTAKQDVAMATSKLHVCHSLLLHDYCCLVAIILVMLLHHCLDAWKRQNAGWEEIVVAHRYHLDTYHSSYSADVPAIALPKLDVDLFYAPPDHKWPAGRPLKARKDRSWMNKMQNQKQCSQLVWWTWSLLHNLWLFLYEI